MKISRPALVLGLASALALTAMTTSSQARSRWVGPAAGFAAGAIVGAAAANAAANSYYYSDPYYNSYAYEPTYAEPAYVEPAYAEPTYVAPAPRYNNYKYGYTGDTNYIGPWKERQLQGRD